MAVGPGSSSVLVVTSFDDGSLHVDFERRDVTFHLKPLDVSPPEYNMLVLLVRHCGQIVPFEEFEDAIREGAAEAVREGADEELSEQYEVMREMGYLAALHVRELLSRRMGCRPDYSPIEAVRARGFRYPRAKGL